MVLSCVLCIIPVDIGGSRVRTTPFFGENFYKILDFQFTTIGCMYDNCLHKQYCSIEYTRVCTVIVLTYSIHQLQSVCFVCNLELQLIKCGCITICLKHFLNNLYIPMFANCYSLPTAGIELCYRTLRQLAKPHDVTS